MRILHVLSKAEIHRPFEESHPNVETCMMLNLFLQKCIDWTGQRNNQKDFGMAKNVPYIRLIAKIDIKLNHCPSNSLTNFIVIDQSKKGIYSAVPLYHTVNFLQNHHNRHPIAHPWG